MGRTSDEENGWSARPIQPRLCKVVVVIGVGAGIGVFDGAAMHRPAEELEVVGDYEHAPGCDESEEP